MAGHRIKRKGCAHLGKVTAIGFREVRRDALHQLRQIETIEELLAFDLASLELYADSVADERQRLTRQLLPCRSVIREVR